MSSKPPCQPPASSARFSACARRHRLRSAPSLHGRNRWRVPRLGFARGGTGAISNAIADAAREAGAEIRTQAAIAKIIVKDGKARGVVLANGDEIYAETISSSVDPRLTFNKFIEAEHLPAISRRHQPLQIPRLIRQSKHGARCLPNFKCMPGPGRTCAVRCRFRPQSNTWSAPTTTQVRQLLAPSLH